MARRYSDDLRVRVVAAMEAGGNCRRVGAAFGIAPSTAGNWHRRYRQTQSYCALPMGGDHRSKLLAHEVHVAALLSATSDLRLVDVQADLAKRKVLVSWSTVRRTVKRLGLRIKKTIFATEQDRPDIALARQLWQASQAGLDFASLVFVDETGTNTAMTRSHGWGHKGRKLFAKAPHGHWMTSTFVAGLAHDGILAPQLLPCPMTGMIFQQWLEECLIPEMKPGSIVVIDNLPAHKVPSIRKCLETANMQLLYLPPYSPDFNPIEQVFSKIKGLLKQMNPRSFDAICEALKIILEKFKPGECANFIRHSGYVQT